MDITYEQAKLVLSALDDAIIGQTWRIMSEDDNPTIRHSAECKRDSYIALRNELGQRLQTIEDEAKKVLAELLERGKK